jgi:hypothetical protein
MPARPLQIATAAFAVAALTGCVPAVQGLARLNNDESIDVVLCGPYESTTLEFDFYVFDEWDGDFEWSATSPMEDRIGLQVLSFGVPPEGWTTEELSEVPTEWDTFDVEFDIGPGPSFDRSELRVGEWVQTGFGFGAPDQCEEARQLVE